MKNSLHILFLTSWYPSRVSLDVGDFIQRHAEAVSLKNKVTVVHVISDVSINGMEITDEIIQNVRTLIAYIKPANNPFSKALSFFSAYRTLLKKAGKFDVVHVNKLYPVGIVALFLKIFSNKKYIISEHYHIYHHPYNKEIGSFEKLASKIITKNAKFVCPVSDNLGSAMQSFGLKGNYKKVPNVVKTDLFYPKDSADNSIFTLLHVSSMASLKNVKNILEVIAELQNSIPNFAFYLIGYQSIKYKDYATSLGINPDNIKYIDQIDQKELAKYYREAAVFLLFSSIENLPCVILESFSTGTQVISSNVGGIKEYFPENFGFLIEKGDKTALLENILKIHTNIEKPSSKEMHTYVQKNFSPISIAKMFDDLYRRSFEKYPK